jgi:polyhydroxybutyrate depolymerase
MTRFWKIVGAILAALLIALVGAFTYFLYSPSPVLPRLSSEAQVVTFGIDGHIRNAVEYVPQKLPSGSPLVIVLHGAGMDGAWMRTWTGYEFDALADKDGFAVFYPDAYKRNWNDCRIVHNVAASLEHVDDMAFMRALINRGYAKFHTDPQKVFVVGYSNGGRMAITLATQKTSLVAGIAIFASNLSAPGGATCPQDTPTPPVMMVEGTKDPINPFNGGEVNIFGLQKRGMVISAHASAEAFASRNGLAGPPTVADLPHLHADDPTSVRSFTWLHEGKPYVVLYQVNGGGHVVPQPAFRFPRLVGRTTGDLDGPAQAIQFFGIEGH